jgi:hypothetical protein
LADGPFRPLPGVDFSASFSPRKDSCYLYGVFRPPRMFRFEFYIFIWHDDFYRKSLTPKACPFNAVGKAGVSRRNGISFAPPIPEN